MPTPMQKSTRKTVESSKTGAGRATDRAVLLALLLAACSRGRASGGEQPAPSASIISIGVALGACTDVAACEQECDAGAADRCRRLGATYAFGQGGAPKDETRATELYERACAMSDPAACVFAGQMHEFAHGVPKDDAAAARFYERACDLGWPAGCYNLAIMLELGHGVKQDRARAGDLYQVACTAGATQACAKAREMHEPHDLPWADR
jgi:TPR repeat protein